MVNTEKQNQNERNGTNLELNEAAHLRRISTRRTLRIVIGKSITTALIRVGIGVLRLLSKRGLGREFLRQLPNEFLSLNPLKWATIAGGFSSFHFCLQTVSRIINPLRISHRIAVLISGIICSLPVFLLDKETRAELSLYVLVRAVHVFCLRFILPKLPECLQRFEHYDVMLMCINSSQIAYGFTFFPQSLPKSYQNFLTKASLVDERLVRGHAGFLCGHVTPDLISFCQDRNAPFLIEGENASDMMCNYVHPGITCNQWILRFIPQNMLRLGIPLYGPLCVITTLATRRKHLMARPMHTITRGITSVITSSLFVAVYSACIVRAECFSMQRKSRGGHMIPLLCLSAGLSVFLEPKGRRMDLALYCSVFALRSFVLSQNRMGRLPYPRHWAVVLMYFVSIIFLIFQYEEDSALLHPRVRYVLQLLLGKNSSNNNNHKHPPPTITMAAKTTSNQYRETSLSRQ
ncbi:unnamed protein product [Phytomonas sp. EM1]|nr:unnamed protein product [Phytomonas sp. EM1]|eukprot:CCW61234.1 unnamed protein product [Phytomonas sp. isolate EM1]